ncbi:hypothetical protein EYF80_048069 [Liparis tanakae]|uniref:Uncharacterized protein n=1 Tax=Liparis tanakae TaxID=230148 RepID=A0A4Z2FL60_9TELE|nr:hypothetical protein EYF80_048069 [Liparis tanakae]
MRSTSSYLFWPTSPQNIRPPPRPVTGSPRSTEQRHMFRTPYAKISAADLEHRGGGGGREEEENEKRRRGGRGEEEEKERRKIHSLVLCVAKLSKRVPGPPSVTDEDVQVLVVAEEELSSVVIGRRLSDLENAPHLSEAWSSWLSSCVCSVNSLTRILSSFFTDTEYAMQRKPLSSPAHGEVSTACVRFRNGRSTRDPLARYTQT